MKTTIAKDGETYVKIWNVKIWIRLPFYGKKRGELVKTYTRKLKRCFKTNVKFVIPYDTKKYAMFCSAKDKIPTHQKFNVSIYKKMSWMW